MEEEVAAPVTGTQDGGDTLPSFDDDTTQSWRFVIGMPDDCKAEGIEDTEERIAVSIIDTFGGIADGVTIRCGETLRGTSCVLGCIVTRQALGDGEIRDRLSGAIGQITHATITIDVVDQKTADRVLDYLRREGKYAGRHAGGRLYDDCVGKHGAKGDASGTGGDGGAHDDAADGESVSSVIAIALETTGIDANVDEIVRLAAYGNHGSVVYDRTFGIEHPERWSAEAQRVSTLSPEDVDGLLTFRECLGTDEELAALLDGADVIIAHNILFVVEFLSAAGVRLDGKRFGDTCTCFGRFAMGNKLYRATRKLSTAAHAFKVPVPRNGHTNEKAFATYSVWLALVSRRFSELMDIGQLRETWLRKNARRLKARHTKDADA